MSNPFEQRVDPFYDAQSIRVQQNEFSRKLDELFYQQVVSVFLNAQGELLLQTLEDLFIRQPVCPVGCKKGYGYFREGQNDVIYRIQRAVQKAKRITG